MEEPRGEIVPNCDQRAADSMLAPNGYLHRDELADRDAVRRDPLKPEAADGEPGLKTAGRDRAKHGSPHIEEVRRVQHHGNEGEEDRRR